MRTKIDIENWKRKEHFYFFLDFDEPYSSRVIRFDVTRLYRYAKKQGVKFSNLFSYLIAKAAMETEPFRLRIDNGEVYCYDTIDLGGTILRDDETFGFSYQPYTDTFAEFVANYDAEVERIKSGSGIQCPPKGGGLNRINYSITPWASFTGYAQARNFSVRCGVPIITVGKAEWEGERFLMPVSIHVHHSLMDGIHVGRYIHTLQRLFDEYEIENTRE